MALTGEPVDAETAFSIGLVSAVVEPEALIVAARQLAKRIAVNPPQAVRMTKRLLRQAYQNPLESVLELSAAMQALAHATEDHRKAVAALLTKTTASFDSV